MPYAIRLPLVLKTVVVHLLLPAALAISLGAAGGVVHADVLPPQMQDASESAAAAEAELTQGAGDRTLHPVIRLGVLTHSPPWYDGSFVDESVRWLAWKLPQFRFATDYLGTGDLMRRMEAREIDLAVAPASFFFFAQRPLMNRFVASIVSDAAVDAEESAAAAVIVRRDREDLKTLADLKGRSVSLVRDEVAQAVESINDEAVRAAQIIDRVRSWSQGRVNRQVLEADQGVKRAVQSFMLTNRSRGISIRTGVLQSVKVWMDPLELELIVVNLLSNAAEAARKSDHPTVMIDLQTARESLPGDVAAVVLTITDNGPALSDQTFAALGCTALQTTREGGLGLGLMIVRTLAENNVGRLTFERLAPHGLAVHVTLPVWMPEIKKADIDLREKTRAADDSKDPSSHSAL